MSESRHFDTDRAWQSDSVAVSYDERRFSSLAGRVFDHLEKKSISHCLDLVDRWQPIGTALDIPCGSGRISELLLNRGYQLTCGDIAVEMMGVAREKLSASGKGRYGFVKMDIFNLPYPDNTFDCVTCIRLFQHFRSEDRSRALRELARVSKKYVVVNATYTSLYYAGVRKLRKALGRYAPRYTMSRLDMTRELASASLGLAHSRFPQRGVNANMVMLLEKR